MQVGDKITIPFGSGTKEGVVVKVCEKNVWLRVDFPRHPGKLIRRKLSDLEKSPAEPKGAKRMRFWKKSEG